MKTVLTKLSDALIAGRSEIENLIVKSVKP